MGKISPVSAKYIVNANIEIDGVVDRPDVIGAIFGQTEGLLGADLELRELQRSGRIGRIEVITDTKSGKTKGSIVIPSSLDKAETSIVGAALEVIQRIGPCNARLRVTKIEDVRISKRNMVVQRAKELLKIMMDEVIPDSQELSDEVSSSVRVMEIQQFGKDRLPAGPSIEESDEIIIVEGRADVINLLKYGFKNAISMNGTSVPETIIELSKKKEVTLFVDGDRGGSLIFKELISVTDVDFFTKAPDGKEVEELTQKELHKALRSRISGEQAKLELGREPEKLSQNMFRRPNQNFRQQQHPSRKPFQSQSSSRPPVQSTSRPPPVQSTRKIVSPVTAEEKKKFRGMLENLIGTRAAQILDSKLNVLGKVPMSELQPTLTSMGNAIHAVVFDGVIDKDLTRSSEKSNIKCLIGMDSKVKQNETKVAVLTVNDL